MTKLPDGARLEQGRGGLERLSLSSPEGEAHVYTHGANVTHFQPRGERPVLWLSARSQFEGGSPGKPIRGGVPLCFPWFGPRTDVADAPLHGVARLLPWTISGVERSSAGLRATLELRSNDYTRRYVPEGFALRVVLEVGRTLEMTLEVQNDAETPFRFAEAQHSYFAVGDARRIAITGLEGALYLDKTDGGARKTLDRAPLVLTGETDRVFPGVASALTISDPAWERRLLVERRGSATAVVWNPWTAKAKAMPDFGDDEWTEMVCVESANALENAVTLDPGGRHALVTTISVQR